MAAISQEHVQPLTIGFVGALTIALIGIAIVNFLANK